MCVLYVFRDKKNSVENYFRKKNTTTCTPQEAAILTESVLSMICKDMRPISVVEGEGFKEMLTYYKSTKNICFEVTACLCMITFRFKTAPDLLLTNQDMSSLNGLGYLSGLRVGSFPVLPLC